MFSYRYAIHLPREYEASDRCWPLILFLHGAGERGDNLDDLKRNGIPQDAEHRADQPFIIVAPQCPFGQWWVEDSMLALLDEVLAKFRVDPDRIYLTGLSMGGYGTWHLACRAPERFAAIAPICGGGLPSLAYRLVDVPTWAFHGARDLIVPVAESERMVRALKDAGGDVRLTIYPEAGHDSWTETYNNPALYEWFLAHRRANMA